MLINEGQHVSLTYFRWMMDCNAEYINCFSTGFQNNYIMFQS